MRTHDRQDDAVRPSQTTTAPVPATGPAVATAPLATAPLTSAPVAAHGDVHGGAARPDLPGPSAALPLDVLQRSLGNAAVARMLEARHRDREGAAGEQEPATVRRSSVPDVLRSPGKPLAGAVRADMEARLGADFSDVRLHTGAAAQRSAAEVGARAYTSGSHVVIGAGGADRHTLAHELTHVIQQRQGPVPGTDNGSGLSVSDPSDRFERAAEANARRVLSGPAPAVAAAPEATAHLPATPVQRVPARPHAHGQLAVQRAGGGEALFDHAQYYAKAGWQDSAEEFEKRLGAYAFRDGRSLAAARATVARLKKLLIDYARTARKSTALANKSFFLSDTTSGGQVGENMTTAQINAFFSRDGNLRELMTALYNAAYYNTTAPDGGAGKLSLKEILNGIIGPTPNLASTLGMNEEELKKHSAFLNSPTRALMEAAANVKGKGYNYAKDPYALGNILAQSQSETFAGDTLEMINSQAPRQKRDDADRDAHRKSPRDYEDRGAPLSTRELEFAGKPGPDDKLPWIEGTAYYEINQASSWAKSSAARGIPVVAGMSGTTTRMIKTFQWMNVPGVDPFDYRMAVMGWMLPSWDHSLYEILRGSWAAGVKGPKESVLRAEKGAALMYQNIAPFTEEELRRHVCVGGHFPHELMYVTEAGKPRDVDPAASGFMEPGVNAARDAQQKYRTFDEADTHPDPRIDQWKRDNGVTSVKDVTKTFKPAHATALMTYTGGAHAMINAAVRSRLLPEGYAPYGTAGLLVSGAESFSLAQIKSKLRWAVTDPDENVPTVTEDPVIAPQLAAAQGTDAAAKKAAMAVIDARIDVIAPPLFEELKAHADMTMEALNRLPPVTGTVYRGDWNIGGDGAVTQLGKYAAVNYRPGTIFTTSFDSTSREEHVGMDFMRDQRVDGAARHRIFLELTLTGKYGRDIDPFHQYQGTEAEVLLMPGARFKVTSSEWKHDPGHRQDRGGSDWYEHVKATEV